MQVFNLLSKEKMAPSKTFLKNTFNITQVYLSLES